MAVHSGLVPAKVELDWDLLEILFVMADLWEDKLSSDKEG